MDRKKIDRINELAHISKQRELTPEEIDERKTLREEYIQTYRANLMAQLDSMVIERPDGTREHVRRRKGIN